MLIILRYGQPALFPDGPEAGQLRDDMRFGEERLDLLG
jgi:hypothetical protein